MAIPQLRAEGIDQGATNANAFTIDFSGWTFAANDILELVFVTDGWIPVLTTANGWQVAVASDGGTASISTNGGVPGANDCAIVVYWKRAVGSTPTSDPPPVFQAPSAQSGTSWCLQPNSFSGARTSGTPYHSITTAIVSTAGTAVTSVGATSTLANCLFMPRVAATIDDATFNNWTMTGSASPSGTKSPDTGWHNSTGNACSFTGDEGGFAAAGGPRTATTSFGASTPKQAQVTLVMASLAEVAGITGNESAALASSSAASAAGVSVSGSEAATLAASSPGSAGGVTVTGSAGAALGSSIAASSGSTITRTGTSAGTLAASTAASSGTVTVGPVGTEAAALGASTGAAAGVVAVSGTEAGGLAGSAPASSGTISLTGNEAASDSSSTAAATGTVSTPATLAIGAAGIKQKCNGTSPATGTLTSFGVYPAWTPSTTYTLDQCVRVTNAGNIYELEMTSPTSGTSASSGGPTGTGNNITDGSVHWNFLATGTGACNTQATGSLFLYSIARGTWVTPGTVPRDNKGNTLTTLDGPHAYLGFPTSQQMVSVCIGGAGGTGHTVSGDWAGSDEMTVLMVELQNGSLVQSHSYVENNAVSNVVTSASVTTTGPAILVAIAWENGGVISTGTKHLATWGSGFTRIEEATALMENSPSGGIQVSTAFRSVTTPGTYTATVTTSGEGSAMYLIAVQAQAGITGTEAGLSSASVASSSGTVTTPRTGTEAATLAASAAATAGTVSLTGSGGASSGASTAAIAGTVAVTGSESATAGGSIASSTGTLIPVITGTEAAALGASIAASFGSVLSGHVGLAAGLLAGSAVAAAGTVLATGLAADVASASSPASTGAVTIAGSTDATSSGSRATSSGTVGLGAGQFRRLTATLAPINRLHATLQLEGVNVLDLTGPILVYQGDTADFLLTVTDDAGGRVDLTGATIELQVKAEVNDPDPPLISKSVGAGWTLLDQGAPSTKGQATCSLTTPETSIAAKRYMLDVVLVALGQRQHVVAPVQFIIGAVVNGP